MKLRNTTFAGFAAILSSAFLHGANPAVIANAAAGVKGPVGVAATTTQLLFTQPFCDTPGLTRGVYTVNTTTGVPSLYAAIPVSSETCVENYLAISLGKGGFTAGATYVTQEEKIYVIPPGGGSISPMALSGDPLVAGDGHSGIGFDNTGTFGNRMIFSSAFGIWLIDSAGVATKVAGGFAPAVHMESPAVAPASGFGAFSGFLFVTAEDESAPGGGGPLSGVYYVAPGGVFSPGTPPTKFINTPGSAEEAIQFVPPTSCSLVIKGTAYQGFSSVFSQNSVGMTQPTDSAIVGYPTSDFAGLSGKAILTYEYAQGSGFGLAQDIQVLDSTGNQTPFDNLLLQLEGFNVITCDIPLPPPPTCPLTIGYWKNHTEKWNLSIFPYKIGGVSYSSGNFLTLLTTPPQGDAKIILAQQLFAAILNVANGAPATPLIAQADALLTANSINLVSSPKVPASSALGQLMVALGSKLEAYNSSCE